MEKVIDFKKYTSINIGSRQKVKIINSIKEYPSYKIIGKGNNLLISNKVSNLAILGDRFNYIIEENNLLKVGASTSSGKLLTYCKNNNIANMEFLAKLPGSIGGLAKMNGGLKEWEIFNQILFLRIDNKLYSKDEIDYSYRYSNIKGIIYEVIFKIDKGFSKDKQNMFISMRDNQPHLPSAGSCFKNPKDYSAGYLLEKVGLKGYRFGGMEFSSIHANFLVNNGNGTFDEALELIKIGKKRVKKIYNI
ncbi:MAG: UDP-N-acetylmuramate dehydrogenase, partial [Campylobacterota bacterium]|nr:UDP-N-acetylmuramate dehydrogenase [Campylobacterota bacterium]